MIEEKVKEYLKIIGVETKEGEVIVRCPLCREILTTKRGWKFTHCGEKHIIRYNHLSFTLEEIDLALEDLKNENEGYTITEEEEEGK